jgi:hypothetical protein
VQAGSAAIVAVVTARKRLGDWMIARNNQEPGLKELDQAWLSRLDLRRPSSSLPPDLFDAFDRLYEAYELFDTQVFEAVQGGKHHHHTAQASQDFEGALREWEGSVREWQRENWKETAKS